jgi:hypothetical protein
MLARASAFSTPNVCFQVNINATKIMANTDGNAPENPYFEQQRALLINDVAAASPRSSLNPKRLANGTRASRTSCKTSTN